MQHLKINPKNIKPEEIEMIVDYFLRGKTVVYPTDTVYGIGGIATDKKVINKIYQIKNRDKNKPLLILVKSFGMLRKYCYLNNKQERYIKQNIYSEINTRPTSIILKTRGILPIELNGGKDSIAIRLPKHNFLGMILKKVSLPIISTSLNISGQELLVDVENIENYFAKHQPDLIVDAGKLKAKPSRLIDLRDINNIQVIRK